MTPKKHFVDLCKKADSLNIPKQKKYFVFYSQLPLIFACIILFAANIWGIIDPIVFTYHTYRTYFGIMRIPNGFLCWFIWILIGAVAAAIVYFIGRIILSQKILTVLYLQYICENNNDTVKQINTETQTSITDNVENVQDRELKTLKQLFDAGAISEQEYENKKKEILGI